MDDAGRLSRLNGPLFPDGGATPVPVTTQVARAIRAARIGWARPPAQGTAVTGSLFMNLMQAQIAEKLEYSDRLTRYLVFRDAVHGAMRLLNAGDGPAAGSALEACNARLPEFAPDSELEDLARTWLDSAWAYYDLRRGDPAAAETRLASAMESAIRVEQVHGYDLIHVRRVHSVHQWLQVRAAAGADVALLEGSDAIVAYVNGFGSDLPLGAGWSREAAARIPAELAAGMTWRVAYEVGIALGGLDQEHGGKALDRVPALARLDPEVHGEVTDWVRIKRLWSEGRADDFLARVVPYLTAGRRETCLWYAVLLDLCRVARALRPRAGSLLCAEVAGRAGEDSRMPQRLGREFTGLTTQPAGTPWVATTPVRRFHLVSVGLPRTGAGSLFTLFGNFRAAHEYASVATIRQFIRCHQGALDRDALRACLVRREREGALEMDATSFLHLAGDLLPSLNEDTRFILPVREPDAWFESTVRELQRTYSRLRRSGESPPAWQQDLCAMLLGRFDWEEIATPEALRASLPDLARRFLTHWAEATGRMLDALPPERTLVLRTEELGPMRGRLAAFAGLSADALTGTGHATASPRGASPLHGLPEGWLALTANEICGPTRARALERCAA